MHITPAGTSWKPKGILQTLGPVTPFWLIPTRYNLMSVKKTKENLKRTVDEVAQHYADGNHDLEQAGDAASNVFGGAF